MKNKKVILFWKLLFYIFFIFLFFCSNILTCLTNWFSNTFSIGIEEVFFTIKSPLQGANTDFFSGILKYCNIYLVIIKLIIYIAVILLFEVIFRILEINISISLRSKNTVTINCYVFWLISFMVLTSSFLFFAIRYADSKAHIFEFLVMQKKQTKIYEEKYKKPEIKKIKGQGRNLIYIYLESMETTYTAFNDGGRQDVNYIPNLTQLANENINFSSKNSVGGFVSCTGSTWTMGALFCTSTGVPFAFPVNGNEMNLHKNFASGIITLGDILAEKGYNQEFLCGSDGNFAGRKQFYEQHGNYKVFDLYKAREEGYISEDYYVWWGVEDEILYRIAKDELLELAKKDKPFNFTMLTVDTHHVGGYKCRLCGDEYPENLANVLVCADKQVYQFVNWLKEQDFYDNTTIVIMGDHPRMDSILINDIPYSERYVYNCFINSNKSIKLSDKNRCFTTIDMFPTVLSAMGFVIEGDRIGLGTDLFSDKKTYSEEYGVETLNEEFSKYSQYYIDNFS